MTPCTSTSVPRWFGRSMYRLGKLCRSLCFVVLPAVYMLTITIRINQPEDTIFPTLSIDGMLWIGPVGQRLICFYIREASRN